jgi:hypothetical protein
VGRLAEWHIPIIPALGRLRQELEVSLDYRADLVSKKKRKENIFCQWGKNHVREGEAEKVNLAKCQSLPSLGERCEC